MIKKDILLEIFNAEKYAAEFLKKYEHKDLSSSTFDDWNFKDVLAHIYEWLNHSLIKLKNIKQKAFFTVNVDPDDFNKKMFFKDKDIPLNQVIDDLFSAYSEYKDIVAMYTDEELPGRDFPTGFSFELWRYILLDASIHPCRHMMYQYLKDGDYGSFIDLLKNTGKVFSRYSDNNLSIYNFKDFTSNTANFVDGLTHYQKANNNDILRKIIDINKK